MRQRRRPPSFLDKADRDARKRLDALQGRMTAVYDQAIADIASTMSFGSVDSGDFSGVRFDSTPKPPESRKVDEGNFPASVALGAIAGCGVLATLVVLPKISLPSPSLAACVVLAVGAVALVVELSGIHKHKQCA